MSDGREGVRGVEVGWREREWKRERRREEGKEGGRESRLPETGYVILVAVYEPLGDTQ